MGISSAVSSLEPASSAVFRWPKTRRATGAPAGISRAIDSTASRAISNFARPSIASRIDPEASSTR